MDSPMIRILPLSMLARRLRAGCWLAGAAAFCAIAGSAQADPSFDCTRATLDVEFLICETPSLAKLDQQMADVYFALLEAAPPAVADEVRQSQRAFLRTRTACTAGAAEPVGCIAAGMRDRLAELQQFHADLSGAAIMTGGAVVAAPGITWQAARPGPVPDDAYYLTNGNVLCAVGLPDRPTIGVSAGGDTVGCTIARDGQAVTEQAFFVLRSGAADFNWQTVQTVNQTAAGAVDVWRDGDDRVQVCGAEIGGTMYIGTYDVGDACVVLYTDDTVVPVAEEILVLAGFSVMTAPN